jgi:hypothetical protein
MNSLRSSEPDEVDSWYDLYDAGDKMVENQ